MSLAGIGLALSVAGALGQIKQGQAQAAALISQGQGLQVQADWEKLKGRQESLKSKRVAVNQLAAIVANLATTTAIGAAGNIDPFSGSVEGVKSKILDVGGLNVVTAKENAAITVLAANFQATQLRHQAQQAFAASSAAKSAGVMGALMTLGSGVFGYAQAGGTLPGFLGGATAPLGPSTSGFQSMGLSSGGFTATNMGTPVVSMPPSASWISSWGMR